MVWPVNFLRLITLKTIGLKLAYLSKGNRKVHDIPRFRLSDISPLSPTSPFSRVLNGNGTKYISTIVVYHSTMCACDDKQPWVWIRHHFLNFRLTTAKIYK